MTPTRTERLQFTATLDKAGVERHAALILDTIFKDAFETTQEGDMYTVIYTCHVDYFGEVERHLRLFEALLDDPELVVDADIEELEHGESILVNVVEQITRIKLRLEEKKAREARLKLLESVVAGLQPGTSVQFAAPAPAPEPPLPPSLWSRLRDFLAFR